MQRRQSFPSHSAIFSTGRSMQWIDAQKRSGNFWAKEDYETADKETAVAKARAKEALDKAEAALGKHLADTVPYTADNARRNAWDAYHDWVNKGYGIADKITAKEREIQDLEEQLAELENRIGKEVRSGRKTASQKFCRGSGKFDSG